MISNLAQRILVIFSYLILLPGMTTAELQVGLLFTDGMVLQRDRSVPVWGTASPGDRITVGFRGQSVTAQTDASGKWQVELVATDAGGPYEMEISTGDEGMRIQDVLVGDVWVCSGQSNMEWTVADSMNAVAEVALASDSALRHFKVPRSWSAEPMDTLAGGHWESADPEYVGSFTAVGYFFAREIRREIGVPIGLINTSWGGSRIEPWMSADALEMDDADVRQVLEDEKAYEQEVRTMLEASVGGVPDSDRGFVDGDPLWADPDLDDANWDEIVVPAAWEAVGYPGMDGIAWYRTSFHLTAEEVEQGVRLGLGAIDDSDISWVNGHEVGRTENAWNQARVYEVSPGILEPGRNVLAVRVEDPQGGGGIQGDPNLLFVESGGHQRSLVGSWKFAIGYFTVNLEDHKRELPTLLYNHMVYPLLPFPIKGVLWYQGESNADYPEDALAYRELFADMIRDWRRGWEAKALPFLWVQLASFMPPPTEPMDSVWATLRESQTAALALPHTAQAIILDVGEALDVHPINKQSVGYRLALAARAVAYGQEVVYSGPTYKSQAVEGNRLVINFHHIGSGLVAKDAASNQVRGFAIAGSDGNYVWANASIEGNRVVVWHPSIPEPVSARYAWADNPESANLVNREGLPAAPFRTDSW